MLNSTLDFTANLVSTYPIYSIMTAIVLATLYTRADSWGDKSRLTLAIVSTLAAIGFLFFIKGAWEFLGIKKDPDSIFQLTIIPLFTIEYILVFLAYICINIYDEGGLNNLKYNIEGGVFDGMIRFFKIGFPVGWALGLLLGAIEGISLIHGLIGGSATALGIALIVGIAIGYKEKTT